MTRMGFYIVMATILVLTIYVLEHYGDKPRLLVDDIVEVAPQ